MSLMRRPTERPSRLAAEVMEENPAWFANVHEWRRGARKPVTVA